MRVLICAALLALAACSTGGGGAANSDPVVPSSTQSPFPVQRGTAPPPPSEASESQSAPPEGRANGGVDFGQWRSTDATTYAASFQHQITAREQGRDADAVKADLEANGFTCESGGQLECRIEVSEAQCAREWFVVVEAQGALHVGYESSCAPAARGS